MQFSEKNFNKCYHRNTITEYLCTTKAVTHYLITHLNKKIMVNLTIKTSTIAASKVLNNIERGGFSEFITVDANNADVITVSSDCFDKSALIRICCGVFNA